MFKQLASLLCSLFVPRRSVSGGCGGGGSLTIYGKRSSEIGISDFISGNILVHTATDTDAFITDSFIYVAPADGVAWIYATQAIFVGIRNKAQNKWPTLTRLQQPGSNLGAYMYIRKGQQVEYHYGMSAGMVYCYFCPI